MADGARCPICHLGTMREHALREDDGTIIERYAECDNCFYAEPLSWARKRVKADSRTARLEVFA